MGSKIVVGFRSSTQPTLIELFKVCRFTTLMFLPSDVGRLHATSLPYVANIYRAWYNPATLLLLV